MNAGTVTCLLMLVFALPAGAADEDRSQLVQVGQTRSQITTILGNPDRKETVKKSGRPIWGPEEAFWDEIPDGTQLEVWTYTNDAGQLNLYFMQAHDRLDYKAFAPKGRVYEAE
jgi:hypothetical protein